MSKPAARPVPEGFHALTPHLVCKNPADAIAFYQRAFGAEEVMRINAPNGAFVHGCLRIGDSMLMIADECPPMGGFSPAHFGGTPVTIHLSVADADASFARAASAGATPVMPVTEMFWGARYGVLKDPYGHSWSVATQVKDLSLDEIRAGLAKACASQAA
jgi:uncharacterized glyoxalase superfamily protein PhnB